MTSNIRLNYEKVMREAARLDGEENVFEEQVKKICGVAERLRLYSKDRTDCRRNDRNQKKNAANY